MKVWISRDRKGHDLDYLVWISEVKPVWTGVEWLYSKDATVTMESLRATGFKAFFGFTPRKGTCKEYNLTLEEVK